MISIQSVQPKFGIPGNGRVLSDSEILKMAKEGTLMEPNKSVSLLQQMIKGFSQFLRKFV